MNLDLLIEAADQHFREDEGAISVFDGRFDGVNYSTRRPSGTRGAL